MPQSEHPHFLLNSGRRAMDRIFPGFEQRLIDAGALHMMPPQAAAHYEGAGWIPRGESTMTMVYASRLLIERTLRDMIPARTAAPFLRFFPILFLVVMAVLRIAALPAYFGAVDGVTPTEHRSATCPTSSPASWWRSRCWPSLSSAGRRLHSSESRRSV